MEIPSISDAEYRLCLFVWKRESVFSGELVKLCAEAYGWARSTTHTLIRRLMDRGVLHNKNGTVTALISKDAAQDAALSEIFERRFDSDTEELLASLVRLGLI